MPGPQGPFPSDWGTDFASPPRVPARPRILPPREKIVPVHAISPLIALSFERGWDAREMFPFIDFEAEAAAAPGQYLSYNEGREAFLRARRRLGSVFAVDYPCRKSLAFLGVVGLGMLVQATLGAALRFLLDFQSLAGVVHGLELEAAGGEASVVAFDLTGDAELASFWRIDHLMTVANLLGQLPCDEARPLRIELDGLLSEEARGRIAQRLGCAVLDSADRSRLVYNRKTLESPLRFPDRAAAALWRQAAERELAALPPPGARSRVQRLVSEDGRLIGRREVSRKLGVSERSLDRLLAREGVRFSALTEIRRLERAKTLLRAGKTVEDVAEALGYSEARSFRRAFQRGAGLSPIAFKQSA